MVLFAVAGCSISIHALRVEGDRLDVALRETQLLFLSTPSGWRATDFIQGIFTGNWISIHALRVEGDSNCAGRTSFDSIFLSTPSGWRATSARLYGLGNKVKFLSTPSGWRATTVTHAFTTIRAISIHALRVEGDFWVSGISSGTHDFYPRPPGGGRPSRSPMHSRRRRISIHALRVEGDYLSRASSKLFPISIHALRVEGDTGWVFLVAYKTISIHALRVEGDAGLGVNSVDAFSISIHALRVEGDWTWREE